MVTLNEEEIITLIATEWTKILTILRNYFIINYKQTNIFSFIIGKTSTIINNSNNNNNTTTTNNYYYNYNYFY